MSRKTIFLFILVLLCLSFALTLAQNTVTVTPTEYPDALTNPYMGFRDGFETSKPSSWKTKPYQTVLRHYIHWNLIENLETDGVQKIIDYCNTMWAGCEAANVKIIPRVILQYGDNQYYFPSYLTTGDYTSQKTRDAVVRMIAKLGQAWDNDPRVAWIQMGIIGKWGEQETPGIGDPYVKPDNSTWASIMEPAFEAAFPNKLVIVRNQKYWKKPKGVYWDSFAHTGQYSGSWTEINSANNETTGCYLLAPVEGEVAYNWGNGMLNYGYTPTENVSTPAYYNFVINSIKQLHCASLGWISGYTQSPATDTGANLLQKAFGYRFVITEFKCSARTEPGSTLTMSAKVKNTGSAVMYENWPVAFVLINESTRQIVYQSVISGTDIRNWKPGSNFDWDPQTNPNGTKVYLTPAVENAINASISIPSNIAPGPYLAGLTILEPYTRTPGIFFAVSNFFKQSQTQPLARIGIGADVTNNTVTGSFDNLVTDDARYFSSTWSGPIYNLTLNASTGGTVTPASSTFRENQKVILQAVANLGYVFSGWSGDISDTTNPLTITMNSSKNITANFKSVFTYTLNVSAPNATVVLTPSGGVYNSGEVVTVKINPNLGYIFSSWSGDLSGTTNPGTITMSSDKNVTANLSTAPIYTLTTNATGGTITLDPAGPQYTKGTVVMVTAKANPGYMFSGWAGDPLNSASYFADNSITMDTNKSITATFIGPPMVTGLWVETFDLPDGTTIDTGATAWTAIRSSGVFGIVGNRFAINNAGPQGVFTTGMIDISGGIVDVSVMVEGAGGLDPETSANKDYFGIFVKVDGGAETLVYQTYGAQPATTISKTGIIGKTLQIVIKGNCTSGDEFYYFNNLKVAYSGTTLIKNGDFSLGLDNWTAQINPPAAGNISVVNKECQVVITAVDDQPWHINILQSGVRLEKDINYTLSFDARATTTKSIVATAQFDHDPWTSSLEQSVTISNVMKRYSVPWMQSQPADLYKVGLFFGTDTADVWVTNLQLTSITTGINDRIVKNIPVRTTLEQNYPNPFNPETTISYFLSESSHTKIVIRNILGQEINKVVDRDQPAGRYSVKWNGRDSRGNKVSSGVYFYMLETKNSVLTKKLVLLQ